MQWTVEGITNGIIKRVANRAFDLNFFNLAVWQRITEPLNINAGNGWGGNL